LQYFHRAVLAYFSLPILQVSRRKMALMDRWIYTELQKLCTFEIGLICGWWRIGKSSFQRSALSFQQEQVMRQSFLLKTDD
jgi:hypothetical protein